MKKFLNCRCHIFLSLCFVYFDHRIQTFSADVLANYVEFAKGEDSKKQSVEVDVLVADVKECVDHLMVVEDVDPLPEPNDDEATIIRRATKKRKREEGVEKYSTIRLWSG